METLTLIQSEKDRMRCYSVKNVISAAKDDDSVPLKNHPFHLK